MQLKYLIHSIWREGSTRPLLQMQLRTSRGCYSPKQTKDAIRNRVSETAHELNAECLVEHLDGRTKIS